MKLRTTEDAIQAKYNFNVTCFGFKINHIFKFLSEVENKIVKENDHVHIDLWPNDQSTQL